MWGPLTEGGGNGKGGSGGAENIGANEKIKDMSKRIFFFILINIVILNIKTQKFFFLSVF